MVAAMTIAVIEIGKYSNRLLQLKLGALNALFIARYPCVLLVYFAYQLQGTYPGTFGFGLYLPFRQPRSTLPSESIHPPR